MVMTIVPLPDGQTALLRDPQQMSVDHREPMALVFGDIGKERFTQIVAAQAEDVEDLVAELGLTRAERRLLTELGTATVWALLESWTVDLPFPKTWEDLRDIPGPVYDPISEAAGRVYAEYVVRVGGFDVSSVENPASPTGASAGSSESSTAEAAPRTSARPRRAGSRSTGTGSSSASPTRSTAVSRGKPSSG